MSAPRLRLRLREQIPLLLLGVALAVGALCWSLQLHFSLSHVHVAAAGEARETAARLARAARRALDERDLEGLRRELAGLAIHRKVAVAAVFDAGGRLLAAGGDVGGSRTEAALLSAVGLARTAFETRLRDAASAPSALLDNDAGQGRVHLYRGIDASAHTPAALLYLMYDYSDHLGVARRHAELNAVLLALLVALSALLIGWFLHHRVTLRAWRVVDVAERYGHGERGLVCGLAGHDELARVGQALDRMMGRVDDTQARLADAENAQRRLIENLPGAVFIEYADRPGYSKYASPQLETLFGHDPEQWATGGHAYWYAHLHPADRERADSLWRESCEKGAPYFCEYRLMAPDGQFHWVQDMVGGAPVVVDGERLSYGFMLDVSARRQTEEALREHVHLLKTAQAVAGVGAWSAEPSFDGRVRWSDETCRLFGALPEQFPHTVRAWLDGVHAEDRARVVAAFERLFAEENDGSIELRYRYRRADGVLR
ncbi:MAG: PAS domain-containing protein [Gammaproteobacteria bacterium]